MSQSLFNLIDRSEKQMKTSQKKANTRLTLSSPTEAEVGLLVEDTLPKEKADSTSKAKKQINPKTKGKKPYTDQRRREEHQPESLWASHVAVASLEQPSEKQSLKRRTRQSTK